jgi:hypothetical protein
VDLQPVKKSKVGAVFAGFVITALIALIVLLLGAAAVAALTLYAPNFEVAPQTASPNYNSVISTDAPVSTVPPDDGKEYLILLERDEGFFCYHIPVVNLDSAAKINEEMYNTHSSHIQEMVYDYEGYPFMMQMTYSVYRKGDIVSVMVQESCDTDLTYFYIYNFSAVTGEKVSDREVFAAFGLSEAEGRTRIKESLTRHWDAYCEAMGDEYISDYLQEVIDHTLDNSNIQSCTPFIDANGNLRYTGSIYSLGGADSYDWIFDDNGNTWRDSCQVQHTS